MSNKGFYLKKYRSIEIRLAQPVSISGGFHILLLVGIIFLFGSILHPAYAVEETQPAKKAPVPAADKIATTELPKEVHTLQTGDSVQLVLTYYPGTRGKESAPVVLLHGYGKSTTGLTTRLI